VHDLAGRLTAWAAAGSGEIVEEPERR
jgi:hypothetical protein